jgi:flagellar biogenesis protein FliO
VFDITTGLESFFLLLALISIPAIIVLIVMLVKRERYSRFRSGSRNRSRNREDHG